LTALNIDGTPEVSASLAGLTSNAVSFIVQLDEDSLAFTADPAELELYTPEETTFYFTYDGQPLPAGLAVGMWTNGGLFENLPANGATGDHGEVIVPALTAIHSVGPLPIWATVSGRSAGKVDLGVILHQSAFNLVMEVQPDITYQFPDRDPGDGPFIRPCQTFTNDVAVTYKGRALANEEVLIEGFGFTPTGTVATDQRGLVSGSIYYSLDDLDLHNQTGGAYYLTVNGVESTFSGPKATNFTVCGRP
jgi:hypothetical protein